MRSAICIALLCVAIAHAQSIVSVKDGQTYAVTLSDGIVHSVPKDAANAEYQKIQEWTKAHAVIAADPPPDPKVAIRLQLYDARRLLDAMQEEQAVSQDNADIKADVATQTAVVEKLRKDLSK